LAETKNIIGNDGWHGSGWYQYFQNINLKIDIGNASIDKIKHQFLSGDVSCPSYNNGYGSPLFHDTNVASEINSSPDGVYTLCFYALDLANNMESTIHRQLIKKDTTSPKLNIKSVSGVLNLASDVYYNNSSLISIAIGISDPDAGYTRSRFDLYHADDNFICTNQIDWSEDNLLPTANSVTRLFTKNISADGNYCLKVWSYDDTQNQSLPTILKFNINQQQPSSVITNNVNIFRQPNFDINYTVSLDSTDISLCYSYNLGSFTCLPQVPVNSHFDFDSPRGDGIYQFYTLARNGSSTEIKIKAEYSAQVDTTPPTSGFNFTNQSQIYDGQNLIKTNWQVDGEGDHHLTDTGYEIGFRSGAPDHNATDSIYQTVSIPQYLSTDLSFKFRVFSEDTVGYDQFKVDVLDKNGSLLENLLTTGSSELGSSNWNKDSGWLSFTRSLVAYAGQIVRLWFGVTNGGDNPLWRTWAYLDDLKLTTLDTRVGDTLPLSIETHDTGSGIGSIPVPTLVVGENNLNVSTSDIAGNSEATKSASIIVNPIVINKVSSIGTSEWIELFNNGPEPVDVYHWYLENESQQILIIKPDKVTSGSTIIMPNSSLRVNRGSEDYLNFDDSGGWVYLKNNNDQLIDSTKYIGSSVIGSLWQRSPDGLGTWNLFLPESESKVLNYNLVSRKEVGKITFTVFNIPSDFGQNPTDRLSYEVKYTNNVGDQGFAGDISPHTVIDSKTDRDFYLGTCSSGGSCRAETNIGPTITVTLTGNINGNDIGTLSKTFAY
jgi:hypothetical protein